MKSFAVYAIRNTLTGELYIGASTNIEKRWKLHKHHLSRGIHHSPRLQADWDRLGKRAFEFVVLEDRLKNVFHMLRVEQKWIDHYDAVNRGYNVVPTAGSQKGLKHSEETKARIRAWGQGRPKSPEHRAKIGAANVGRVCSEETKARISAAKKAANQRRRAANTLPI